MNGPNATRRRTVKSLERQAQIEKYLAGRENATVFQITTALQVNRFVVDHLIDILQAQGIVRKDGYREQDGKGNPAKLWASVNYRPTASKHKPCHRRDALQVAFWGARGMAA